MKTLRAFLGWLFGRKPQQELPKYIPCIYRDKNTLHWFYRFRFDGNRYYGSGYLSRDIAYSRMVLHKEALIGLKRAREERERKREAMQYRKTTAHGR